MAKKYSKYTSNYILSQPIQKTEKGTINLRDWTTIGEFERLNKGKKPVFGNGEFRFTVRNVASNPTKHVVSKFVGSYNYNDVKDVLPKNNLTELNLFTNDIRDYAYYGSATELVRATIQNIVRTFPARISISNERILNRKKFVYNGEDLSVVDVVDFDFMESFDVFDPTFKVEENEEIVDNSYETIFLLDNPLEIDIHHESIILGEYTNPHRFLTYSFKDFVISDDGINFEPIIKYIVDIEYNKIDRQKEYTRGRYNCVFDGCKVAEIKITTATKTYTIDGYLFNSELKWGYKCRLIIDENGFETNETSLYIQPNQQVIDEYFNNLKGFEKILLQRESKPLYQCRLKTPYIENEIMMCSDRPYQFPHKDGFIDVVSPLFTNYIQQLMEIANVWDMSYSDNLYQRMTHEAIKNYDWSFKKDEDENEKQDVFIGGLRIENLLHIYGRLFDDIKHYIDGIKNAHIITYNGYNNMPTAHITDELEDSGWHIVNTIPVLDVTDGYCYKINNTYTVYCDKDGFVLSQTPNGELYQLNSDINTVDDTYYYYKFDNKYIVFCDKNGFVLDKMPDGASYKLNLEILNHTYSKEFSEQSAIEDLTDKNGNTLKWFDNKNQVTFNSVQNNLNFMKKLVLNSNYIFKSKGTKKSIEMIMGMFGFGDDDFTIKEICYQTQPKRFDSKMSDTFDNLIASFEGLVTEDTPEGSLPIKIKEYYKIELDEEGQEKYVGIDFLVPFLNVNDIVDVDLYFQGKGGWCKNSDNINKKDYTETMSYLRVKYTLEELFTLSPNSVKLGDVFYVVDIANFSNHYPNSQPTSHYFIVKDINKLYNSSGWTNVNPNSREHAVYNEYINYMESIVATNIANNPHVGYGHYDMGEYYLENMRNPFKYAEDNFVPTLGEDCIYKTEADLQEDLTKFQFNLTEVDSSNKVFYIENSFAESVGGEEGDEIAPTYYINSKVVKLINNLNTNSVFSEYFKEVILPYIMQVIPSTTILILKNF